MGTTSGECMVALAAESATGNVSPCKGVVFQMHCCEVLAIPRVVFMNIVKNCVYQC